MEDFKIITDKFIEKYKNKKINWGFNGLGNIVYRRTYSRLKENGEQEIWPETIQRCINGAQKIGADYTKEEAERLFDYVFNLKCNFAGRSLWQLGTSCVDRFAANGLINCFYISVKKPEDFCFIFENLMMGCVPPTTKIITENGIKEIRNINIGDKVYSYNNENDQFELDEVLIKHNTIVTKNENIKITCKYGNFITSKNHPILVRREGNWVYLPAENLQIGDILKKLVFNQDSKVALDEKAYFAGAFLGDGCSNLTPVNSRRIRINGDNEFVIAKFTDILSKLTNIKCEYKLQNDKRYSVPVWILEKTINKDNPLAKEWINIIGDLPSKKTYCLSIPNWIKNSHDKNVFLSFLCGLIDTDGFVCGTKVAISSSSLNLINDLISYCPLYGLYPHIHRTEPESYTSSGFTPTATMYRITFSCFDLLKYSDFIFHNFKRSKVIDACNGSNPKRCLIIPPDLILQEQRYLDGESSFETKYSFRYQIEKTGTCRAGYYHSRKKDYSHLICYDQIVNIETDLDLDKNFQNLTTSKNHNYVCGDGSYYVLHNCGVGFSVRREHIHELPRIKSNVKIEHFLVKDTDFIVPDSRQGWVELLRKVLNSFFVSGTGFTYSTILVRGYGEPIRSFGGTASGPKILIDGITNICRVFKSRENKKLRSIDVLDIVNIIGSIVIAGNIRRSSEIALGDADDHLFIRAKRWDSGEVPNWRTNSNNTILADDFSYLSDNIWDGYNGNGEPYGLFNLPLSQKTGRLGDKIKDNAEGLNPCVRGDTIISIFDRGCVRIDTVIDQEITVWNGFEWSKVIPKITGHNQEMLKITLDNGQFLVCTKYHRWCINCPQEEYFDNITRDEFYIKEAKDVKIGDSLYYFNDSIQPSVISIENAGIDENVYCFYEPKRNLGCFNGIITLQCGEISLESCESCNLSELYLNNIQSKHELVDCAKLLYKTQKAICALPYLHKETTDVVHRNFRLGLGITGICQSINKLEWLDDCYKELKKFDREWSKKRCWPESIKLTTCKPSGSLSLLSGSSPGVHPAYSKYYIRRVRMASNDKLIQVCRDAGYYVEYERKLDNTEDHNTQIILFPCYAGENVIIARDMSAVQQLELSKKIQTLWSDNSVSCTVYYKKEELSEIKEWLKKNYEDSIKSVSFLLHQDHGFKQAPYEEICEEKYKELTKNIKPIENLGIQGDNLEGLECASGSCPIK